MDTTETLKRRIHTAEELYSLVRTMKALAAVNIRQLERAVASLDGFQRTIELGLRGLFRHSQGSELAARLAPRRAPAAIVLGSDQGMCGQLNEQVAQLVAQSLPGPQEAGSLIVIGQRVAARLEEMGYRIDVPLPVAASIAGIAPLVRGVLVQLDAWQTAYGIDRVEMYYAQHLSRAAFEPRRVELLPLDRQWLDALQQQEWPTRAIPAVTMDTGTLFSALVRQYLFVSVFRACAETMASENASRLAAMRGAERNISDRITELTQAFHQTRQMAITEELLDIASGFEALRKQQ
ncbi:MAG: F0F1 ATP synthase subunit gamma [Planctomycetota bacterium]|nr:MAG: F0F1 ATP synthase subunit gamma [Planctomycetota bacterium]